MEQQLSLAYRTLLAMLLLRRPGASAPKAQRDAFKTLCVEVQARLRDGIAEGRRVKPASKATPPKGKSRAKVGHA